MRWKIAITLVQIGERSIANQLVEMITDSDIRLFIRLNMANLLGQIADTTIIRRLISLLKDEKVDVHVRARIADTLSSLELKDFMSEIKSLVANHSIDTSVRAHTVYCLVQDKDCTRLLIDLFKYDELKEDAYLALYRASKQANQRIFFNLDTGYKVKPLELIVD